MKIERLRVAGLEKQEWHFLIKVSSLDGSITFTLSKYFRLERPSKRHKFKTVQTYESNRPNATGRGILPNKDYVPVPEDVIDEAKERMIASITYLG
jgi:hypothetical protein